MAQNMQDLRWVPILVPGLIKESYHEVHKQKIAFSIMYRGRVGDSHNERISRHVGKFRIRHQ